MALVLVVGCEEGSTTSQQLSEEQESLLSESMVALVPILFSDRDLSGTSLSFDEIFTETQMTALTSMLGGEAPQYICCGTELEGSISISGCVLKDFFDTENSSIPGTTEVTITYSLTVTGTTIPGGTAAIVVTTTGEYADFWADDANDDDFDVSVSINGQQFEVAYTDL